MRLKLIILAFSLIFFSSTGSGFNVAGIWTTVGDHYGRNLIGDFDGDGKDDLIQHGLIP